MVYDRDHTGLFITFEGPDGSGKTTQIKLLAEALERQGYRVLMTREPGGTSIGDQIRTILLSSDNATMNAQAEALLMAASRAQHVHEKILPALADGYIVLCDRFVDASMAYQAAGLGLDLVDVQKVNEFAIAGLMPRRTYMLDISPEAGKLRMAQRLAQSGAALDRIEQKDIHYHRRVREAFLKIAREQSDRVYLLDAERRPDELYADIYADCQTLLRELRVD